MIGRIQGFTNTRQPNSASPVWNPILSQHVTLLLYFIRFPGAVKVILIMLHTVLLVLFRATSARLIRLPLITTAIISPSRILAIALEWGIIVVTAVIQTTIIPLVPAMNRTDIRRLWGTLEILAILALLLLVVLGFLAALLLLILGQFLASLPLLFLSFFAGTTIAIGREALFSTGNLDTGDTFVSGRGANGV